MNDEFWGYSSGLFSGNKYLGKSDDTYAIIKEFLNHEMKNYGSGKWKQESEPEPTIEDKVVDIVKGGFEDKFGITIQEFQEVYEKLVEENPERLI